MDKRIGKLLVIIASLVAGIETTSYAVPVNNNLSVSLRVTDHEGYPLQEAGIGIPFIVQVEVITDGTKELARPQLTFPPSLKLAALGTTNSVRTVNHDTVSKKTYQYSAVCNDEGEYVLGPASLLLPAGKEVLSNTIKVKVSAQQKRTQADDKKAFVEFSADTLTPYVGQEVNLSLRFYYASGDIHLEQLQEPIFKDCKNAPLRGPVQGQATVEGKEYGYLEWKTSLYPTKTGKVVISPIVAYVSFPLKHQRGSMMDMFAMVNQMLGAARQQELYSNALTLQVQPLPQASHEVIAVGAFSSFNAKVLNEKAQTGEGITFVIELIGQGNFAMIGHPVLQLPEGLKYYDSHTKQQALTEKMVKKDFEYVLQALRPGKYEIPVQKFTYFDTKTKSYKTLSSRPISITVEGEQKSEDTFSDQSEIHTEIDLSGQKNLVIERTLTSGGSGKIRLIPWPWFMCITGIGLLFLAVMLGQASWSRYQQRNREYYVSKKAFAHAKKHLLDAKRTNEHAAIYPIFKKLFTDRLGLNDAQISEEYIEEILKNAGCTQEQIAAWRRFFANTLGVTFAVLPASTDLYEEAEQWLIVLERIL